MNQSHIATNEAYRNNYDRIFKQAEQFKKDCPYLCDFGGREENVYCQIMHTYVKKCHSACLENYEKV